MYPAFVEGRPEFILNLFFISQCSKQYFKLFNSLCGSNLIAFILITNEIIVPNNENNS
jgi:hypothetical protein